MPKYINADLLISDIKQMRNTPNGYSDTFDKSEIIGVIEEQPVADVRENVRGEWTMLDPDEYLLPFRCSHCNRNSENKYDFCPNCGADMRGDQNETD